MRCADSNVWCNQCNELHSKQRKYLGNLPMQILMSRCKAVSEPVTAGIAACKGKYSAFNIKRHVMVKWLPLLSLVRKILGSNLSLQTEYPDLYFSGFLQPLLANSWGVERFQFMPRQLLPQPSYISIHQQFYIIR